jgi:hypothetical protein
VKVTKLQFLYNEQLYGILGFPVLCILIYMYVKKHRECQFFILPERYSNYHRTQATIQCTYHSWYHGVMHSSVLLVCSFSLNENTNLIQITIQEYILKTLLWLQCGTAIKALLVYLNFGLWASVMLDGLSCSLTSISFLTNKYDFKLNTCKTVCTFAIIPSS